MALPLRAKYEAMDFTCKRQAHGLVGVAGWKADTTTIDGGMKGGGGTRELLRCRGGVKLRPSR